MPCGVRALLMGVLSGRVAIVTGAAGGLGEVIARAFAAEGARVGCADLDAPQGLAGEILAEGGDAIALAVDVTQERATQAAVAAVLEHWGGVQVLVNGAAPDTQAATVPDLAPADWDRVFAVHVTGAYLMSRAALPAMIAGGGGSIIHMASPLGRVGAPGRPAYCAANGALIQLARAMALDHAAQRVRVNALSPGAVETWRMPLRHGGMARADAGPVHPIRPLGHLAGVAGAALFLASDASSFVTGSDLVVDGGCTA